MATYKKDKVEIEYSRIYNPKVNFPYLIRPYAVLLVGLTVLCVFIRGGVIYVAMLWLYFIIYHCVNDQWQKRKAEKYVKLIVDNYQEVNVSWESSLAMFIGWDETKKITHQTYLKREAERKENQKKNHFVDFSAITRGYDLLKAAVSGYRVLIPPSPVTDFSQVLLPVTFLLHLQGTE